MGLPFVVFGLLVILGAVPVSASSLLDHPELRSVRSTSGQFIVAAPVDLPNTPGPLSTNTSLIELSPHTLVVSCERIKSALLRELGIADFWFGRIHVIVNPVLARGQPPLIGAKLFREGWQYQVEVPRWTEPEKLVRGIVQVLLMEFANRTAGFKSAEIPLWLSEGLSQHLMQSSRADLVVGHPRLTINGVKVRWQNRPPAVPDPLKEVRERLQTHAALSFTRLGEIEVDQMSAETWKTFQASSSLFVDQLLRLPDARGQLTRMLTQLPHHLNWQIAFLNAFQSHFPRMLDAEKWWAVVLVHFSGLDSAHAWSIEVALAKLSQALRPPMLISRNPKELPRRSNVSVQEIIDQFDYLRQRILVQDVIHQLGFLRVLTPPTVVPVLDDYRRTLQDYLDRRDRAGMARSLPGLPPLNSDRLVRETVDKLDALDQQRAQLAAEGISQLAGSPE